MMSGANKDEQLVRFNNMALEDVNFQEYHLIDQIRQLTGSMETIESKINELKIPEIYKVIHIEYSHLGYEGLKRAIFLQWYAVVEPLCYTGIGGLDYEQEKRNLFALNNLFKEKKLDDEFQFMISYYFSIGSWYFESLKGINDLLNYLKEKKGSNAQIKDIPLMSNRGQMGEYWNSLRQA